MQNIKSATQNCVSKKQALNISELEQVGGGLSVHFEHLGFKWKVGGAAVYMVTEAYDVLVEAIDHAVDPI